MLFNLNNNLPFKIDSWTVYILYLSKPSQLRCRRPQFDSWVGKICWRRDRLPSLAFLGFPCGSAGKESACNVRDLGLAPGLGRSPEEGKGYPTQYSGLENSMDFYSMGSPRVGHDRTTFTSSHIYRKIFLPFCGHPVHSLNSGFRVLSLTVLFIRTIMNHFPFVTAFLLCLRNSCLF